MPKVAAVSPTIVFGDIERNLESIVTAVVEAAHRGAELVVAPELATSGYVFEDATEARGLALRADDALLTNLGHRLPADVITVFGYAERDGDRLFNTAAVIGHGRRLADYRKSHLWDQEKAVFTPGDHPGLLVDTDDFRLGVAICYDNEFPEVPRGLALSGASILALPVNWPLVPRPPQEHPPETVQAMAAARSSRLPIVIADRHGSERDVPWTGGSAIIDAHGWIADEQVEGIALADVELFPDDKAIGPRNDVFADRRPELY
ncbi:carbon-nitrogen hydrolase [Microbacterium sp. M28]|uniref:nitrilase-related carbon-nitrogen hydrolase n=1 Tax=Microbacterium sp. M28 TaxID=2962064 RepID=UPI0021F3E644|nr:nitrilase-related carbon-nitrogen hydrolase [Microbacterium sp. M28]UYO96883.1 carbon-nitrogen hydrolase [Microbacterium sp. M28]